MTPGMEKKTWTNSELAARCGVKSKDVWNARAYSGGVTPGSARHRALEKMRELGITWDDVAVSRCGGSGKMPCSTPAVETRREVRRDDVSLARIRR
ncbi:hypothetical protein [uncultured Desulfovibrio sp.]|uniref:hypothetical protein n=1 Tax=uncultured Desulfovibrio sp. TaxID=167968 RepID=UPI002611C143|nr:hypothetical protein [uncultured Desulfovibrio sp.]